MKQVTFMNYMYTKFNNVAEFNNVVVYNEFTSVVEI